MNTLRQAVDDYLDMRRNLGFQLREAGKALPDFVAFMEQHRAPYITQTLALAWAQQPASAQPARWAQRLSYVRGFARYRLASDPRTQIPVPGLLPFQPKRARPYLYSNQEIAALLEAARHMPHRYQSGALLPWVYYGLFGLLSVTGLRLGEALNLELDDVDLAADRDPDELLALHEALETLEKKDRRKAELVKLRFFAGLTQSEAAAALSLPPRTAARYWAYARAWLYEALCQQDSPEVEEN